MGTLVLDGKKYQFGNGVTESQVRAFHEKNKQTQQALPTDYGIEKQPKGAAEQFAYGLKRKYQESGAGLKEFLTGRPSNLPISADLPSNAGENIARGAGSSLGRLSELAAESYAGAKLGQKIGGARGALIGGIAGPFVGGYLKQPGERIGLERLISGGLEAASSGGYKAGKGVLGIYKAGKETKNLQENLVGKKREAFEAGRAYETAQKEIPIPDATVQKLESKILSGKKELSELQAKKTSLEANIQKSNKLIPKIEEELQNYPEKKFDIEYPQKPEVPQLSSIEKIARQEEQFTKAAEKVFDPKLDYNKAAAEEHNKLFNEISENVNRKYNNVLKDVDTKDILAGQKGYDIYQKAAKSLGEKAAPLKDLIPDKILNPEEQNLITGLEDFEKLKSIPTEKVLSFYKTARQTARKFNNNAWQEASGLTDIEKANLKTASKQFTGLAEKLKEVLNAIDPKIISKLKEADAYFAENKAPFYARPEHWEAQKGLITSDILESTHADSNVAPEAAFLRKLIMGNENYRRAALGKIFSKNYKKLIEEGDFEKYNDFVEQDPAVKLIHETLKNYNRLKVAHKRLITSVEKPLMASFKESAQKFKQGVSSMKTEQKRLRSQLESMLERQKQGKTASEEQIKDVAYKINGLEKNLSELQKYIEKLKPLSERKDLTEAELKEIKLQINEARLEYARKKAALLGLDKLASKIAAFKFLKFFIS